MSKMPAKKKSCFQITSVTQAQVAASTAADDTESLDGDPDDSRAEEDGSSEIFDVGTGRAGGDYEPAACGGDHRGSSEEGALTFNNVGDQPPLEPPPQTQTHVPQQQGGQLPSGNPNGTFRIVAVQPGPAHPGAAQPGAVVQPQPALTAGGGGGPAGVSASTSQPVPAAATGSTHSSITTTTTTSTTVSCSSRFRVIKLDHGTGEPFRRGRWTCTEFYEKDSDGSIVSRTVDSIRHASATLVDPSIDRDSGLGQTGGSVATHSGQGLGSIVDTSSLNASRMLSADALQQQQQQMHHQTYSVVNQGGSGTATQNAFAQQQQPAAVGLQPSNAQTLLPIGHNGFPQGGVHLQKSPGMPPVGQPVSYPPQQQQQMLQQVPTAHHLTGQSPGLLMNQTEYYQQPQPAVQTLPATSLPAGAQQGGQGPSPVMTQAAAMQGQVGEMAGAPGGTLPPGQTALGHLQQMQHIGGGMLGVGGSASQHMSAGQYVASGQPHGLHSVPSGVQNVPVVVAASPGVPTSMPAAVPSASSAVMPNSTSSPLPVGQQSLMMPQSNMVAPGGLPMAGFVPGEAGSGRRLDGLASPQPPITYGKDLMKPLIPESLQLATPTVVNSLFGISIPVDGDEDRNPSKAFYQAFHPGSRLRDSKALSDSASGTSVVAIDNKIEQAMDLVKSHLMYAVREEVEVLKEQIKELFERNSLLERENAVLKSLANSEQLSQLPVQSTATGGAAAPPPTALAVTPPQQQQGLSLQGAQANTTQQQQQQQLQQQQLQQQQLQQQQLQQQQLQQQQQQQPTPPPPQVQVQPQPHSNDPSNGQQQQQPLPQPSVTSA